MTSESRSTLKSTLGNFLGFEDGAEDVLDHLLTIESKADLSEYLSQLLGTSNPELDRFVENVRRYQKGEPLFREDQSVQNRIGISDQSFPSQIPSQKKNQSTKASKALEFRRNKHNQGKKSRVPPPKSTTTKDRKSAPPSSKPVKNYAQNSQFEATDQVERKTIDSKGEATSSLQQSNDMTVAPKSHPKRGKAKSVCGCFGTKHKPLTNCLYCGRISCEIEGYDFCPFCGYMVEEIIAGVNSNDKAWIQKERLLRFDREFARRTQIFDDQADYQQHSSWMTEEERKEAEEKEEERREALRRPKQTMNLAI